MDKKQKEFWKQFYQSKNKDEETLKKSLFNGDLTKEEVEYVTSCVIGPLFAPSLFYPVLFKKCPQLIDRCNWTMLNHVEWRNLLIEYPQFADKCDKWNEFTTCDWINILRSQPQFSNKCDIWEKFDKIDWWLLLVEQPHFADKFTNWDDFSLSEWRTLLCFQSVLADKCNLSMFKSTDWVKILIIHPQLIVHCNTSVITEKGKAKLLAKHPDLARYFPEAEKKVDNNQPELF